MVQMEHFATTPSFKKSATLRPMATVHLYSTSIQWFSSPIRALLGSLFTGSIDDVMILVETTELKQWLIDVYSAESDVRPFPTTYTVDEWLIRSSGLAVDRSPIRLQLVREKLTAYLYEINDQLTVLTELPGLWHRLLFYYDSWITQRKPLDRLAEWASTFPSLDTQTLAGIFEVLHREKHRLAYRDLSEIREWHTQSQWRNIWPKGSQKHLVIIGFSTPTPYDRQTLTAMIQQAPFCIVITPNISGHFSTSSLAYSVRQLEHTIETVVPPETGAAPTVYWWSTPSPESQIHTIGTLLRDNTSTSIGIALPDYLAMHTSFLNELIAANIISADTEQQPIATTPIGQLVIATAAAASSGFTIKSISDWLDCRLRIHSEPMAPDAITRWRNQLTQRGVTAQTIEPSVRSAEPGIQQCLNELLSITVESIGDWLYSIMMTVNPPPIGAEIVLTLVTEWQELAGEFKSPWSILAQILRTTYPSVHRQLPIRICSITHASQLPLDRWIVPFCNQHQIDQSFRSYSVSDRIDARNELELAIRGICAVSKISTHFIHVTSDGNAPTSPSNTVLSTLHRNGISVEPATALLTMPLAISPERPPENVRPPVTGLSVSQLNSYQKCPRKLGIDLHLQYNEPAERGIDFDADEEGQIIHLVMGNLLTELQKSVSVPSETTVREWLIKWGPAIINGHRSGKIRHSFSARWIGTVEKPGVLLNSVSSICDFLTKFEVLEIEKSITLDRPTPIRGRIDLLARHRDTQTIAVIDFKITGTEYTPKLIRSFDHLQVPIYMLALYEQHLSVGAGVIWSFHRKKTIFRSLIVTPSLQPALVGPRKDYIELTDELLAATSNRVQWITDRIISGDFSTLPCAELVEIEKNRAETTCPYCPYRVSCNYAKRFNGR